MSSADSDSNKKLSSATPTVTLAIRDVNAAISSKCEPLCAEFIRTLTPHLPHSSSPALAHVPCKFFKQGGCTAGKACVFSHDLTVPGTVSTVPS